MQIKYKFSILCILLLSISILLISSILFYQLSIYADEHNTSITLIYGGNFGFYLYWLNFILNFFICILSLLNLFNRKRNKWWKIFKIIELSG